MLKVLKGIVLWMLAVGMAFMIETIVISDALGEYTGIRESFAYIYVGCLIIVAVFVLWYMRRSENKWFDIALPACIFVLWGFVRHHILYCGLNGVLCSIAEAIKNSYGFDSDITLSHEITAACMRETILFVTAIIMFFIIFLIERCESMCLAVGFAVLFIVISASVNLTPNAAALIITIASLISLRYIMVRKGRNTGLLTGIILPAVFMGLCMLIAIWLEKPVYDAGMKGQDKLVEAANRIVRFSEDKEDNVVSKKQTSQYNTIDGEKVDLSDEVVKSFRLPEKPTETYYYQERVFNTYNDGTWSYDEATYASAPTSYTQLPKYGLNTLYDDIAMLDFTIDANMDLNTVIAERVHIIAEFIQEHATYTTDPGGFEDEVDPVIYFLYYKHKGYCVHFASAAALSIRASGLPSRYVTGYAIPPSAWERDDSGGYTAEILENYGHAWAEVYNQETDMWIIAEATPGYSGAGIPEMPNGLENDMTWEDVSEISTDESATDEAVDDDKAVDEESGAETSSEESSSGENVSDDVENNHYSGDASSLSDNKSDKTRKSQEVPKLVIIAVSVILFVILVFLMLCIRRRIIVIRRGKYFRSRDRRNAIYLMSEAIYDMLDFSCMVDKAVRDDVEYARIIDEKLDFLKEGEFLLFVEKVQAAVYGEVIPDASDMQSYFKMYRLIRMHLFWSLSLKNRFVWKLIRCYD